MTGTDLPASASSSNEATGTVCVVGLGYIGLPTALLLARDRHVVGVDGDGERVATLGEGELPFEEPGLAELFDSVRDRFDPFTSVGKAVTAVEGDSRPTVDTYLVATPTPLDGVAQVPNLEHVHAAVESVADVLGPGDAVILESTVPPGTTERLVLPTLERSSAARGEFRYAYCPERASPGDTVREMVHNERVVGGVDEESRDRAVALYEFVEGEIHTTDPLCSEFVKLIENTYRDVNVALANEFGKLAEQYGLDGREAIELANEHPRVDILSPGPGVGGHCLPVDPRFLTNLSDDSRLISLAREVNDTMPVHTLRLVDELVPDPPGTRLTVLGVAYKGGVDDTRETPARRFVRLAQNEGYEVRAHDPRVESFSHELSDFDAAVDGSDCLVVVTDHPEFEDLDPGAIAPAMRRPAALDTRGILDRERWADAGFTVRRLADGR